MPIPTEGGRTAAARLWTGVVGRIFLPSNHDKPSEQAELGMAPAVCVSEGMSEEALVHAARCLNEDAWAEVYRRHSQQVYAYIYYRLGDQYTAEDLTADVFVKALAGIKGYSWRGTPLLAWLYRIAHNVTADHRKATARRMKVQAAGEPELIEDTQDHLRELDERTDMMRAIRALTEEQQQVVILRFYQGLSNAEVARIMGKPEGAVKALQSRGLRSLRRIITGAEERQSA